jgi:hypothetical protein
MILDIKLDGATVLQDALIAPSDDGREVFVYPANIGAPLVDEHPSKKTVVVSLPTSAFEQLSNELTGKGRATLSWAPAASRESGIETHGINYEIEPASGGTR